MRTHAEHLGNQRLTRLLRDADARGLARSGIGGTTGTPLPAELAARMAAIAGARASRVNFSYSVRISSRLDSDDLLIEFIKQYRGAGTNEEARRIGDQEDWKRAGTAPTVTEAHTRQGHNLIPVTDRSITPATADERRQRQEFLTGLSPAE
ncbi:hypothetical protein ACF09Y_26470 [Streptomyces massasporeus]|uniref:hypothetical protein n=1 Tax=Streptomyces massasporeus TaxID=67324 RepID=UPI0036FE13AD